MSKSSRQSLVVKRAEYTVDGGQVLDEMSGTSRIDLVGEPIAPGATCQAAHLFVTRGELCLYPIGAKVRVTVERTAEVWRPARHTGLDGVTGNDASGHGTQLCDNDACSHPSHLRGR